MTAPEQTPRPSHADPLGDGRLHAPAAERNTAAILTLLRRHAPDTGRVLELASGTGQHAVAFATALTGLDWTPSEVDPARLDSIRLRAAEAGLANVRDPITLDAAQPGWGARQAGHDLVLLVNLLHLVGAGAARTVIAEAAQALVPGGRLILYGPFLRAGETTSEGDARFHASLTAQDPAIGYKDDFDVADWIHAAGLELADLVEMPANNLAFIARKPGPGA